MFLRGKKFRTKVPVRNQQVVVRIDERNSMNSRKSRRNHFARIFGNLILSERPHSRTPFSSRMLLLDQLEPRILMAGTPTQLLFSVQPVATTTGTVMAPAVKVEIADANGFQTYSPGDPQLVSRLQDKNVTINARPETDGSNSLFGYLIS